MTILERYQEMQKSAAEEQIKTAQVEALVKFAETAETLLQQNGQEYTADDVVKVASFLINAQLDMESEEEKTAELHDAGREIARGFIAGLQED